MTSFFLLIMFEYFNNWLLYILCGLGWHNEFNLKQHKGTYSETYLRLIIRKGKLPSCCLLLYSSICENQLHILPQLQSYNGHFLDALHAYNIDQDTHICLMFMDFEYRFLFHAVYIWST